MKAALAKPWSRTSLQPLCTVWGATAMVAADPVVERHHNAVYLPWRHGADWGLFDETGVAVASALEYDVKAGDTPGQVSYRVTQPLAIGADLMQAAEELREGVHLYGGRIHLHFGHFLLETLSRFWWLVYDDLHDRRILVHGPDHLADYFNIPWMAEIFGALGLSRSSFVWADAPTRFDRVATPGPAFRPQSHAHPAFAALCRKAGNRLMAGRDLQPQSRPVYLSKTRLSQGVNRIENEAEVEEAVARAGVEVIHPETLSIADQVSLFHTRPAILGAAGSAFHLSLFAPPRAKLVCLNVAPEINANFILIDRLTGNQSLYLHQPRVAISAMSEGPFCTQYRLADPKAAAKALLAQL